jgi:excisionase family DNA binding protein
VQRSATASTDAGTETVQSRQGRPSLRLSFRFLTTQEAADLLNVSRPTLVRLLTDGEIAYTMRGRHRRVLLRDILDYSERSRTERRSALDQMAADAEDDDLHETTMESRPSR